MKVDGKVVVVTGGGRGIGRALVERFAREGARQVVVADITGADEAAEAVGGLAVETDVSKEGDIMRLVEQAEERCGPIDLFCSNAGIGTFGGVDVPDVEWQRIWDINVMAHVYAARALVPRMIERGGGYLLATASAAGLLTQLGSAPYSVTKHASVALAEWLAITHGEQGIKVSVLCPQGVRTAMTAPLGDDGNVVGVDGMMEPEEVAEAVIAGLDAEQFLILPHPEVADYVRRKADDHDRWIAGMQRLQARFLGGS